MHTPIDCPACGSPISSVWAWVLPRTTVQCSHCQAVVGGDVPTRTRQMVALIFGLIALLLSLGLLLGGDRWLFQALLGIALYLGFTLWSASRVVLRVEPPEPE